MRKGTILTMSFALLLTCAFCFNTAEAAPYKKYRGVRISVHLQKADIHSVLKLFAEVGGFNYVVSSRVRGRVSLRLRNVPWDQALDLVLRSLRLGMLRQGNVIEVMTTRELTKAIKLRSKLRKQRYKRKWLRIANRWPDISWSPRNDIKNKMGNRFKKSSKK